MIVILGGCTLLLIPRKTNHQPVMPLEHGRFTEIETTLTGIVKDQSPTESINYLRELTAKDASIARDCHPLSHMIGKAAYTEYRDFAVASSYQDAFCNSGYLHGVIQAYFLDSDDISESILTACSGVGEPFERWQCYHGVGHGVMYATGNSLDTSISWCETIDSNDAIDSCINGVFMEQFITVDHSGQLSTKEKNTDITLCATQPSDYKNPCYIYAPSAYLEKNPNDYLGAFHYCEQAGEDMIAYCITGLGGQIMKDNIHNPEAVSDFCNLAKSDEIEAICISGSVSILVNHFASTETTLPYCDTTFKSYKNLCRSVIEEKKQEYNI